MDYNNYITCQKQVHMERGRACLFTIGYEGISVSEYMNYLLQNSVKVLVDVRNKPFSRKPGFSKNQLATHCNNSQIGYVSFPEVGIKPKERNTLKTQADYEHLFANYIANTLPQTVATQLQILELLKKNKRIALTCFEADVTMCHRKHLAAAIAALDDFCGEVIHIQTKDGAG